MLLAELRALISSEANIKGLREYQTLIDWLINQELFRLTGKSKYAAMWEQATTTISVVPIAPYTFALPTDYQLIDTLVYQQNPLSNNSLGQWTLYKGNVNGGLLTESPISSSFGLPRYYARQASNLSVYPWAGIQLGDNFILSYYKTVTLQNDTDVFPVESLEQPIQLFVIGRLLAMTDTQKATLALRLAETARVDSRVQETGAN